MHSRGDIQVGLTKDILYSITAVPKKSDEIDGSTNNNERARLVSCHPSTRCGWLKGSAGSAHTTLHVVYTIIIVVSKKQQ